ncbi:hypothetical protein TWF718_001152 [Orbilia javanica]|uniref:Uncharacterized protein n=1 Tax=Orbilia javanica TaxID=47235 RepID=A0AAN8N0B0_9PEZI
MDEQHWQEATGRRGERELNPFRHVQPRPPANAGTEEFRREMLQMEQRFAPRVSDSRTRALELERELKSGTSTDVSAAEGSPWAPQPRPTPGPQLPSLRTVILPGSSTGTARKQRPVLQAPGPLDRAEKRLLSPEPASVALPLSPTSADASRFLVLSSPTGEEAALGLQATAPNPGQDGPATTPGLTSGQITPPPRPTPPPTAPRRSTRRPQEFSMTPGPFRAGIQARGTGVPRTAPPNKPVSYSRTDQPSGQRLEQTKPATQQRGKRRISPTYISPPIGGAPTSPFMVDLQPHAGTSTQRAPQPTTQSVFERLSSSSLTRVSGNPAALETPRGPEPAGRAVPPTAMPLSFLAPEHTTPFPGMRTGHNIRDTLRKVAAETPKGNSERTTPADSTVIQRKPEEASKSNLGSSIIGLNSRDKELRDLQDTSPLVGKGIKTALATETTSAPSLKSHVSAAKTIPNTRDLFRPSPSQKAPEPVSDPQAFHPGAMDSARTTHGDNLRDAALQETLNSLESFCGAIKRVESTMRDYRGNLEVDAEDLKRDKKSASHLQGYNTAEGLAKTQFYHPDRVESLLRNFRKKEIIYHENLESLRRLEEDPLLDPTVGIPSIEGKDEHRQRIAFRGRLQIRDALKKLGYSKGPIKSFLEQLDPGIWKLELTNAIIATDPRISQIIQLFSERGYKLEQGDEIDFNGVNMNDLSALPWGNFKVKGLGGIIKGEYMNETDHSRREDKGKGKVTAQAGMGTEAAKPGVAQGLRQAPTPTIPESSSEGEADYEQSFMTDPGMTPRLKNKLSLLGQQEKSEKPGRDRSRQLPPRR